MKKKILLSLSFIALALTAQNALAQTTKEEGNTTVNYPMSETKSHVWNFADPYYINNLIGYTTKSTVGMGAITFDGLYIGATNTAEYLGYAQKYGEIETGWSAYGVTSLQDNSTENKDEKLGIFSYVIPANVSGRLSCRYYAKAVGKNAVRCRIGGTLKDPAIAAYQWNFGTVSIDAVTTDESLYFGKSNSTGDVIKFYSLGWVPKGAENLNVTIGAGGVTTYTPNVNVKIPAELKAYYVSSASGTAIATKEITNGIIPALAGVILVAKDVVSGERTFTFTIADDGILGINDGSNKDYLIGAGESTKLKSSVTSGDGSQTYYILSATNGDIGFSKVGADTEVEVPRYAAFIPVENSADPSTYQDYISTGLTSGINEISQDAAQSDAYYNLQGMKVSKPIKGIFIHHGKKVVMR